MGDLVDSVGLGDQLGQAQKLFGLFGHLGQAGQPFPQAEGMGEHPGKLLFAVQEDPVVGHEHVVEDHEAFDVLVHLRTVGIGSVILGARAEADVHDLDARGIHGNRAGDRVILFADLHGLGRNDQQFVPV